MLDNLPRLREFMERMYKRPNAPPPIAEAFASLRRWRPETLGDAPLSGTPCGNARIGPRSRIWEPRVRAGTDRCRRL